MEGRRPHFVFRGKSINASRVSAHVFLGLDLDDRKLQANHKPCCPHQDCWNPEHLYIGTQMENVKDFWKSNELDRHGIARN